MESKLLSLWPDAIRNTNWFYLFESNQKMLIHTNFLNIRQIPSNRFELLVCCVVSLFLYVRSTPFIHIVIESSIHK